MEAALLTATTQIEVTNEVKLMGTVVGGRYATPLYPDDGFDDQSHPAFTRTARAEKLARAIMTMEQSPCELPMAQVARLLTTMK